MASPAPASRHPCSQRHRKCRQNKYSGTRFCVYHQEVREEPSRVPCPLGCNLLVPHHALDKHLARCNKTKQSTATRSLPCYRPGCNAGGGPEPDLTLEPSVWSSLQFPWERGEHETATALQPISIYPKSRTIPLAEHGHDQKSAVGQQRAMYARALGEARLLDLIDRIHRAADRMMASLSGGGGGFPVSHLEDPACSLVLAEALGNPANERPVPKKHVAQQASNRPGAWGTEASP